MKSLYLLFLLCFSTLCSFAQNAPGINQQRHVRFKILPGDSAVLTFNKNYLLIEDSCADVIRNAHYTAAIRKFTGVFKDVNKNNSAQLISQGNYSTDGLKNGVFTCYYLNGRLQSKGNFVNNKPDGHWDIFYENGKPKISFDAANGLVKIANEWDETGVKVVTNGKGEHKANLGVFTWKGKLEAGMPEGKWETYKTDDATQIAVTEEHFDKNLFIKGKALDGTYKDASRIELLPDALFPYIAAELLHVSPINCNGYGHRHIVGARFSNGPASYSQYMKNALQPVLSKLRINTLDYTISITGQISEDGNLTSLTTNDPFDANLARSIISALRTVPPLNPATADGKPIKQGYEFDINFSQGHYKYTHHFLPIKQADVQ